MWELLFAFLLLAFFPCWFDVYTAVYEFASARDRKGWKWNEFFGIPSLLFNLKICLPLFLLSIICYALLLKCKIHGQSLYKTTAINVEDWNDIIDLDNVQDGGDLEMGVLKTKKARIDPSTLPYSPRIICIPKPFEV